MKKRYISLIELMCILVVLSITGNLSAKLFSSLNNGKIELEQRQQNQKTIKLFIRSLRAWCNSATNDLKQEKGKFVSGQNSIYASNGKVFFKSLNEEYGLEIPPQFQMKLQIEKSETGSPLLHFKATRKDLSYSIKFRMGSVNEK